MSWGLGWKRSSEVFHLTLNYGNEDPDENPGHLSSSSPPTLPSSAPAGSTTTSVSNPDREIGFRIELDWSAGDDEDQIALRLQSKIMVALPLPQDTVVVQLIPQDNNNINNYNYNVDVDMKVVKRREPLRVVKLTKAVGFGQQNDGSGVLARLLKGTSVSPVPPIGEGVPGCGDLWQSVTVLSLCACGLSVLPLELIRLPNLEKLYLDNNKLSVLPPELGELKGLKVLRVDYNMLVSVPVELKQCIELVELSLEHNKIVRLLLDFRAMEKLQILKLFGNPLVFLPEILPLQELRHLSLANIRIVADEFLRSVNVQIELENSSYFGGSKHKLTAVLALIFRFSSCQHPLLASALAKIVQDQGNRVAIGRDENAVRQLISMIGSENRHVVEQACSALSSLAEDVSLAMHLMKADIMQPIERVLKSNGRDEVISVLQVVAKLAFAYDTVSQKMFTKELMRSLKLLCAHKDSEVQRIALVAIGNLAFCLENRQILVTSESLRELLMRLTLAPESRVQKAAARVLAILGENENLRRAIKGRPVAKQGLRILAMDGGGMKGLATVQMLKEIENGTGKRIHEMFDLVCGTSTGGMLAVALGIKLMTLDQCEEIYKNLGKLVFHDPVPKDNEAASWREKLDQLYKSSSQSFRVVVHGSKHSADQFESLLKEMCAEEDGNLLIESAVKNIPKVFVVSTLVSMMPAQPFIFRNYQYPAGIQEISFATSDVSGIPAVGSPTRGGEVGYKSSAYIGSCKHQVWQAIRASSAAPYYLDDFSDDLNRWQDGAIVANNPTIFAIREAQLLWPDAKIDCLVSLGCGSLPAKVRKGGWRYLDTGQILVESACSVDRAEEALNTLLPMMPDIQYFRFNPVDERCSMELDETDPTVWLKLEAAVDEYMQKNHQAFKDVCERLLLPYQQEERWSPNLRSQQPKGKGMPADCKSPTLGWRRTILLVEAAHNPDSGRMVHHARHIESFCARNGIRLSLLQGLSGVLKTVPAKTPFLSPMFTGSFSSSQLYYSPDYGAQRVGHMDMVPPLSLDGLSGKAVISPPTSPSAPRQLSLPARTLQEKLLNSPQIGIVHLALQSDSVGLIVGWHNDVFVVAEPGELAERFLQNVKYSLLSVMKNQEKKNTSLLSNISSVSDLVAWKPYFHIGGIFHRYIGRQTIVMEGDQEIGAYMFQRTVPNVHLSSDDIRCMSGAWRDRIVACTGMYGPGSALIKAFLDSGAKAVICSSMESPESRLMSFTSGDFAFLEKFEIGDEEADEEDVEPSSPASDWEDSDTDKTRDYRDAHEEELAKFLCQFYDALFRENASVHISLQHALASHRKLRYSCHLPAMQ